MKAVIKKISCLILCLLTFGIFSITSFAKFEGNTEVIAHIEAESSETDSSDISGDEQSSISSADSEPVTTGDESESIIFICLLCVSSMLVLIFFVCKRKYNKRLL